jgi:DNA-directed RNA polymerase subunit N (RpoN/RPB10)
MIIPIKCVSCGNVIADKYRWYLEQVRKLKSGKENEKEKVMYFTKDMINTETPEGEVMDKLGIKNVCCRRIFLTHVDIE